MLKGAVRTIVPRIWSLLPLSVRWRIVWLVHATYTVGVSAVIFNDQGEVLYLRHRYREHRGWELPGGLIRRGETLMTALRREIGEETGYDVELEALVAAATGPPLHADLCYVGRITGGTLCVDAGEIVEARFFALDELPHVLRPDQMQTVQQALRVRSLR